MQENMFIRISTDEDVCKNKLGMKYSDSNYGEFDSVITLLKISYFEIFTTFFQCSLDILIGKTATINCKINSE